MDVRYTSPAEQAIQDAADEATYLNNRGIPEQLEHLVDVVNENAIDFSLTDGLAMDAIREIKANGLHEEPGGREAALRQLDDLMTNVRTSRAMATVRNENVCRLAASLAVRGIIGDTLAGEPHAQSHLIPDDVMAEMGEASLDWCGLATQARAELLWALPGRQLDRLWGRAFAEARRTYGSEFVNGVLEVVTASDAAKAWEYGLAHDPGRRWNHQAEIDHLHEQQMRYLRLEAMWREEPEKLLRPEGEWELRVPVMSDSDRLDAFSTRFDPVPGAGVPDTCTTSWTWLAERERDGADAHVDLLSPDGTVVFSCVPSQMTDNLCPTVELVETLAHREAARGWMATGSDHDDPDLLGHRIAHEIARKYDISALASGRDRGLSADEAVRGTASGRTRGQDAPVSRPAR